MEVSFILADRVKTRVILLWCAVKKKKKKALFRSGTWETFHVKHAGDNRSRHAHWWWVQPGLENIIFFHLPLQLHGEALLQPRRNDRHVYAGCCVIFVSVCGTHMRKWFTGRRNTSLLHIKPPRCSSYLHTSMHFLFVQGGHMHESHQLLCTDHARATSRALFCNFHAGTAKSYSCSVYQKSIPFHDFRMCARL